MPVGRFVGAVNAISIALSGADFRQVRMPHEAGMLGHCDAVLRLIAIVAAEEAELDAGGIFGCEREIHPAAIPRRAERIRFSREYFHGAYVGDLQSERIPSNRADYHSK